MTKIRFRISSLVEPNCAVCTLSSVWHVRFFEFGLSGGLFAALIVYNLLRRKLMCFHFPGPHSQDLSLSKHAWDKLAVQA